MMLFVSVKIIITTYNIKHFIFLIQFFPLSVYSAVVKGYNQGISIGRFLGTTDPNFNKM